MVQPTADEVAAKAQAELTAQSRRENLENKLKDGKLMIATSKKDKEETLVIGGGNKKKRNRNKEPAQNQEEKKDGQIAIDLSIISKFNVVMMSPPTLLEELDAKIEELNSALERFSKDGDKTLASEKAKILQNLEREVDEEIAAELADALEAYGEEG